MFTREPSRYDASFIAWPVDHLRSTTSASQAANTWVGGREGDEPPQKREDSRMAYHRCLSHLAKGMPLLAYAIRSSTEHPPLRGPRSLYASAVRRGRRPVQIPRAPISSRRLSRNAPHIPAPRRPHTVLSTLKFSLFMPRTTGSYML